MSTRAQRRAARRNARMSTGPRTADGKATSSRNAIRHNLSGTTFVLLPGEDRAAFEALAVEYRREWNPRTEHETFLVAQMVQSRWRLNRIARMEAEVIDAMLSKFGEGQSDEGAIVIGDAVSPDALRRLHRYAQDAERSYNRAVRELRAYRKDRQTNRDRQGAARSAGRQEAANDSIHGHLDEIRNEPKPALAIRPQPVLAPPLPSKSEHWALAPGHSLART